jgi:glycosyltransferase involved in cell wall biosynthesis
VPDRLNDAAGGAAALSVVLPVFRNRAQLPELLARLRATLDAASPRWEVVCVEDCGGDGAREWLAGQAAADARIVLLANPRNLGQHASIVRGLAAARGDLVAVMDADLQDAPEDLALLLAAWRPGLGAVFARRTRAYQSAPRHRTGRAFKQLMRRLAGGGLPAGVGTFVLIDAEARRRVVEAAGERPYVPLLLARTGLPLASVPIEKHVRPDGASAYGTRRRLALALRALAQALRWRLRGR